MGGSLNPIESGGAGMAQMPMMQQMQVMQQQMARFTVFEASGDEMVLSRIRYKN